MADMEKLEQLVRKQYESRHPNRTAWCDWLYENHVFTVANLTSDLCSRFHARQDVARAAALLHDIADSVMSHFDEGHDVNTERISRELLLQSGYSENDINLIINDIIRFHSCRDGESPKSLEGKAMATADGIAHISTDFYYFFAWGSSGHGDSWTELRSKLLKKIDRDYNAKLLFPEVKAELKPHYDTLLAQLK